MPQFFRLQPTDQPLQRIYCGGCPARNKVMGDLAFGLRGPLRVLLCSVPLRFLFLTTRCVCCFVFAWCFRRACAFGVLSVFGAI